MTSNQLTLGILAHVDAGKTTLTEALLYKTDTIRKFGRVDHGDSFLDTDVQERERGITIYAKNARLEYAGRTITIIDTPGHTDFAGETERALSVLDAAVLLISASDGVQGHTLTLWKLLDRYNVPVIVFINKMDMPGTERNRLLNELKSKLSTNCEDAQSESFMENAAMCDEKLLAGFLENGEISRNEIAGLVNERKLFPCVFGSALRQEGIEDLLNVINETVVKKEYPEEFSARVYKISRDSKGERLAFMKVLGGTLKVRALIGNRNDSAGGVREEKVSQIRLYSGTRFQTVEEATAGTICAVTGLSKVLAGDMLGQDEDAVVPQLEGVFTYKVIVPPGTDKGAVLRIFRTLEEEDPLLRVAWNEKHQEISVQVMGDVQLEILTRVLADRFKLNVAFGTGSIMFKETIAEPVEGVGHYEPLRHYAEVHLLIEPAPRGSGIRIKSAVSVDTLALSWQRLIFTHLLEKRHIGVLTGSYLTDVTITLIAGRAHQKHTEGGDFRQATYRAVRQGLMCAKSVLLEPWYEMTLTVPQEYLGRAINDITRMGGEMKEPLASGEEVTVNACVPVRKSSGYAREVTAYSKGMGRVSFVLGGYRECPDADEIITAVGYDPERDIDNPADSVFCSHGAGVQVKWKDAPSRMHIQTGALESEKPQSDGFTPSYRSTGGLDDELRAIFERTYGKVEPKLFERREPARPVTQNIERQVIDIPERPEYLLVDGYNIIFSWDELRELDIDGARQLLMDILANYAGHRKVKVILVFDAYKVKHGQGSCERYNNIDVVYTREAETADSYIEKLTYKISANNRVRVASSDGMEQLIILGNGALRMTARELHEEIDISNGEIRRFLDSINVKRASGSMQKALADAYGKSK